MCTPESQTRSHVYELFVSLFVFTGANHGHCHGRDAGQLRGQLCCMAPRRFRSARRPATRVADVHQCSMGAPVSGALRNFISGELHPPLLQGFTSARAWAGEAGESELAKCLGNNIHGRERHISKDPETHGLLGSSNPERTHTKPECFGPSCTFLDRLCAGQRQVSGGEGRLEAELGTPATARPSEEISTEWALFPAAHQHRQSPGGNHGDVLYVLTYCKACLRKDVATRYLWARWNPDTDSAEFKYPKAVLNVQ